MTKIILIRHGESETNAKDIMAGHLDVKLTDLGERQAVITAEYVAKNYKIDRIYSSDLQRAFNTIKPLADRLNLPIEKNKNLREIDAGVWDGMRLSKVKEEYPQEIYQWGLDIKNAGCVGGESLLEVMVRVTNELKCLAKQNPNKTIVCASHGIAIWVTECFARYGSLERLGEIRQVSNASVSVFEVDEKAFTAIETDICTHLGNMRTSFEY